MAMTKHCPLEAAGMLSDGLSNFKRFIKERKGPGRYPYSVLALFQKGLMYEGQETEEQHL